MNDTQNNNTQTRDALRQHPLFSLVFRQRSLLLLSAALSLVLGAFFVTSSSGKWTMVWSDEFVGSTLSSDKWNIRNEEGKYNHELQYYSPSAISMTDGDLRIATQRQNSNGRAYTSGAIDTKGKYFFLYGRVEICARIPHGQGIWPAFWLLPEDRSWPPEIDVMEALGQDPSVIHMTNYWGTVQEHPMNSGFFQGPDFSQGWHTYAMDWEPNVIRWYVDGVERFTSVEEVPSKPMYLVLNTAVGGDLPGSPDASTPFPQRFDIKYVHVWQHH